MSVRRLSLSFGLVWLILLALPHRAEAQEYLYEMGMRVGAVSYMGDASRSWPVAVYRPSVEAVVRHNANFRWAWTAGLAYHMVAGDTKYAANQFPQGQQGRFRTNLLDLSAGGEFNFVPLSDKFRYLGTRSLSPYLGFGAGLSLAWASEAAVAPHAYLAFGVKYKLSARLTVEGMCKWQYLLTDRLDALSASSAWLANPFGLNRGVVKGRDAIALLSIGVTYQMRLRKRSDCQ